LVDVAQIEARAEGAALAAYDNGADFLVALDHREGGVEPFEHRTVERIAFFWTVENERYVILMTFDLEFVGHLGCYLLEFTRWRVRTTPDHRTTARANANSRTR